MVGLEACGMRLAPFELREMMEQADRDGDGVTLVLNIMSSEHA
jgi:hypothetical protein